MLFEGRVEIRIFNPQAKLVISDHLCALKRIRNFVRAISNSVLDDEGVDQLELAVHEVICNMVPNVGRSGSRIQINAYVLSDRVVIRLSHPGESVASKTGVTPVLDISRKRDFGLDIANECTDRIRFSQNGRGQNCVSLTKLNHARSSYYKARRSSAGYLSAVGDRVASSLFSSKNSRVM